MANSKKRSGNGHPRRPPGQMKPMAAVPEAEPTPEPERIERINTVRIQVMGDRVLVRAKRACGHSQSLTLAHLSDVTITFGNVLVSVEGQVQSIEDCMECEFISQQRQAAMAAMERQRQKDQEEVPPPALAEEAPENPEEDSGESASVPQEPEAQPTKGQ